MLHLTPALTAYVLFLTLVLGLCFGSFLNCLAWRLVHGERIWRGRSHCALCNHPLGVFDRATVVSFLCL
jgi:leader peptidase (prepilin peptidase)/N-methyltransferase